jgi:hypothetical protein
MSIPGVLETRVILDPLGSAAIVQIVTDPYRAIDVEREGLLGLSCAVSFDPIPPEEALRRVLEPWHRARRNTDVFWVL